MTELTTELELKGVANAFEKVAELVDPMALRSSRK
jgi:hypothetical protein